MSGAAGGPLLPALPALPAACRRLPPAAAAAALPLLPAAAAAAAAAGAGVAGGADRSGCPFEPQCQVPGRHRLTGNGQRVGRQHRADAVGQRLERRGFGRGRAIDRQRCCRCEPEVLGLELEPRLHLVAEILRPVGGFEGEDSPLRIDLTAAALQLVAEQAEGQVAHGQHTVLPLKIGVQAHRIGVQTAVFEFDRGLPVQRLRQLAGDLRVTA